MSNEREGTEGRKMKVDIESPKEAVSVREKVTKVLRNREGLEYGKF